MCERCRGEDMSDKPVEERLKLLEDRQYLLLQTCGKLVDDLKELDAKHEAMSRAFSSFAMKVMNQLPALRAGMERYIDEHAEHVGKADQMKKMLADIIERESSNQGPRE